MATSERTTPLLLGVLALLVGYIGYTGAGVSSIGLSGIDAQRERVAATKDTLSLLEAQIDSARKELANGTAEDLRKKLDEHRASLALLRRLVPATNEVPNLLDDISTRAKFRGVNFAQVVPMPVEPGPAPFDTYRYTMSVMGHYDQIGEFFSDVASLQRIIVPQDVQVTPAQMTAAKALNDTSGAMLEAKFQIRTYVKSAAAEGEPSGT
jgi:Tfp pilus assembly protein PilO